MSGASCLCGNVFSLGGYNDRASDVRQLGKWFRGKNVLINLLQYNETACKRIKRPNKQQLVAFKIRLEEAGLEVKLRESRGNRIKAACGQLVSDYNTTLAAAVVVCLFSLQNL